MSLLFSMATISLQLVFQLAAKWPPCQLGSQMLAAIFFHTDNALPSYMCTRLCQTLAAIVFIIQTTLFLHTCAQCSAKCLPPSFFSYRQRSSFIHAHNALPNACRHWFFHTDNALPSYMRTMLSLSLGQYKRSALSNIQQRLTLCHKGCWGWSAGRREHSCLEPPHWLQLHPNAYWCVQVAPRADGKSLDCMFLQRCSWNLLPRQTYLIDATMWLFVQVNKCKIACY